MHLFIFQIFRNQKNMAYKHTNSIWNHHPDLLIMTSEIFFWSPNSLKTIALFVKSWLVPSKGMLWHIS
ncbi:hypothetical protein OAH81_04415 [Candidatus Pseudothioglobus singularis]|nr:hypothetical protein [Candidatus Pseudothioglobus singularis]MDB4822261.1 hypothetical protein [Candidatus Pseudothioglobus singularis]